MTGQWPISLVPQVNLKLLKKNIFNRFFALFFDSLPELKNHFQGS